MPTVEECYQIIEERIASFKSAYPSMRSKTDDYVFSALCVKTDYFKNPAYDFDERTISSMMVDGTGDGGVDAMFFDPDPESNNLVLVQSKHYKDVTFEELKNAVCKMADFYTSMESRAYTGIREDVVRRFVTLNADVGDESKVVFVLYVSAPQKKIQLKRIEAAFNDYPKDARRNYELRIVFSKDIVENIKDAESRRPDVEIGKLAIDEANNYLVFGEDEKAIIANVSALCIKELYAQHGTVLLAKNLRYHVSGTNVDRAIEESIQNNPEQFWFKNNGITIICEDFDVSGKEIKLRHFSVINGGQTTYKLFKSRALYEGRDFYLPVKVIKAQGNTEEERHSFSLAIAQATNSQKAIKPSDLKANSSEQIGFANAMRNNGIFYQTKRGDKAPPKTFSEDYQKADLNRVGKLWLATVFQMPATSRNKPSMLFSDPYYGRIFQGELDKQARAAKWSRDMLYFDAYFKGPFLKQFDKDVQERSNAEVEVLVAHNGRTICEAFATLAFMKAGNRISNRDIDVFFDSRSAVSDDAAYRLYRCVSEAPSIVPDALFENKDSLDAILYKLYCFIIRAAKKSFLNKRDENHSLDVSNFLKTDESYYSLIRNNWDDLSEQIQFVLPKTIA